MQPRHTQRGKAIVTDGKGFIRSAVVTDVTGTCSFTVVNVFVVIAPHHGVQFPCSWKSGYQLLEGFQP